MRKFTLFLVPVLIGTICGGLGVWIIHATWRPVLGISTQSVERENPLADGEVPPPEFTKLAAHSGQIRGVYRKDGHEVRFFTARGPALSVLERSANIPKFEMSMCFINEQGYPLFTVAGGDGVPIPECNKTGGEFDSDKTTEQEAKLAHEAMQAIAQLSFRPEYEPEKYILAGSLAIANTLDHVLADGIQLP